jgi:hypothetical protein
MLLSIVFGMIGEMYLPGRIVVPATPRRTAANLTGNPMLLRLAFASYLVEGFCDIFLCVFWYILLRPVDRNLALLSAFVGVVSMVTFAVAQSSFFASSLVLRETDGMLSFTLEQRQALALLCIRISTMIAWLFVGFYGTASMIRGYLIAPLRHTSRRCSDPAHDRRRRLLRALGHLHPRAVTQLTRSFSCPWRSPASIDLLAAVPRRAGGGDSRGRLIDVVSAVFDPVARQAAIAERSSVSGPAGGRSHR